MEDKLHKQYSLEASAELANSAEVSVDVFLWKYIVFLTLSAKTSFFMSIYSN